MGHRSRGAARRGNRDASMVDSVTRRCVVVASTRIVVAHGNNVGHTISLPPAFVQYNCRATGPVAWKYSTVIV